MVARGPAGWGPGVVEQSPIFPHSPIPPQMATERLSELAAVTSGSGRTCPLFSKLCSRARYIAPPWRIFSLYSTSGLIMCSCRDGLSQAFRSLSRHVTLSTLEPRAQVGLNRLCVLSVACSRLSGSQGETAVARFLPRVGSCLSSESRARELREPSDTNGRTR